MISKYSYLMLETTEELQKLMNTLHAKKSIHLGHKYIFDIDRYKQLDIKVNSYTLFDIMTYIYLYNTGQYWYACHWPIHQLDQMKYLQGKLLPLS